MPNASPAASTLERELAAEQAHVDLVYARLAEATRSAQQVAKAGLSLYQSDRNSYVREEDGTGLYERDVFAFQAARRLAVLDAEQEGLVFGRLDRTDGEVRYVAVSAFAMRTMNPWSSTGGHPWPSRSTGQLPATRCR